MKISFQLLKEELLGECKFIKQPFYNSWTGLIYHQV